MCKVLVPCCEIKTAPDDPGGTIAPLFSPRLAAACSGSSIGTGKAEQSPRVILFSHAPERANLQYLPARRGEL
jgi:hypothetical protein